MPPSRLELEITEGVLIDDFSRAVSILRRLKALGVRIAMDDFGTGYSSLSYLQSFPFDKIKIDQAFISNLERNPQSATIIRAVIGLARGLELPVLAEGVETKEQLAFLAKESCDEVQGYLIGRPLPIEDYAALTGAPNKVARRRRGELTATRLPRSLRPQTPPCRHRAAQPDGADSAAHAIDNGAGASSNYRREAPAGSGQARGRIQGSRPQMPSYKLVTYQSEKGPRAGVVVDDKLFDAAALTRKPAYASMLGHPQRLVVGQGHAEEGRRGRRQEQAQEPAGRQGQAARAGAVAVGDLLRRRQLQRPHGGDGEAPGHAAVARSARGRPQALALHQGLAHA